MRKIGTISSALGFIYIGVIWIIYQMDQGLAYEINKYWPAIFILIGIEFIISSFRKSQEGTSFNWICILVIIALIISSFVMKISLYDFNFDGFYRYFD